MERVLLANALMACLLALLAALADWRWRSRPALVHGLWLLVLLKLVTPPVIEVPLWPLEWGARGARSHRPTLHSGRPGGSLPGGPNTGKATVEARSVEPASGDESVAWGDGFEPQTTPQLSWPQAIQVVWLLGVGLFWLVALRRLVALGRLLRRLPAAPAEWQARVDRLAAVLGLRRSPRLLLLEGSSLPPFVACLGLRARLVFPAVLWDRLDEAQRDAVLLHELAHLRRGDHLVRWLELLVVGLYWWFPVVWWAARRLRRAEEPCCDAWVVWAAPEARSAYATALVETVAFLSGQPTLLPTGASGAGPVVALKRRLSMIVQGTPERGLSWSGRVLLLCCLLALPLAPARAQPSTEEPVRDLQAEVARLQADMARQRASLRKTEALLKGALSRLAQEKAKAGKKAPEGVEQRLERLQREVEALRRELRDRMAKPVPAPAPAAEPKTPDVIYINKGQLHLPAKIRHKANARDYSLVVSRNRGEKWEFAGHLLPRLDGFSYTALQDGEYWFAVVNTSGGNWRNLNWEQIQPDLKVVVDTVPPRVGADWQLATEEGRNVVTVSWTVEDEHLDLSRLRLEYRLTTEKEWRQQAVSPAARGLVRWRPAGEVAEVRLSASDRAGNTTSRRFEIRGERR